MKKHWQLESHLAHFTNKLLFIVLFIIHNYILIAIRELTEQIYFSLIHFRHYPILPFYYVSQPALFSCFFNFQCTLDIIGVSVWFLTLNIITNAYFKYSKYPFYKLRWNLYSIYFMNKFRFWIKIFAFATE